VLKKRKKDWCCQPMPTRLFGAVQPRPPDPLYNSHSQLLFFYPEAMTFTETILASPPNDGITNLEFSPTENTLAASSWAKSISIYDPNTNTKLKTILDSHPILDFKYSVDGLKLSHGGLSKRLIQTDIETEQILTLGKHTEAIKCVSLHEDRVFSGSWDKTVKAFDPRTVDFETINCSDKVYSMDIKQNTLVVALANREILIYDTRNLKSVIETRQSSLKYQIRKIVINNDTSGYCTSSIEGYLD
jgi:cell cycle arrest protein BUB3